METWSFAKSRNVLLLNVDISTVCSRLLTGSLSRLPLAMEEFPE
jgi:hypothetical protein